MEEEGGDAEGDASPAPAPQPMIYLSPRATTHTVAHCWRTDGGGGAEGRGGTHATDGQGEGILYLSRWCVFPLLPSVTLLGKVMRLPTRQPCTVFLLRRCNNTDAPGRHRGRAGREARRAESPAQ